MKIVLKEHISLIQKILFYLFSFLYLGVYHQDVLYHIGWKSYFVTNEAFRELTVQQSCGWLVYLSLFLNQIFLFPVVAAVVVSFLLTMIVLWIEKLSKKQEFYGMLNYLPSCLILLVFGRSGMAIFSQFQMATFWSLILGTVWFLLLLSIYSKFHRVPVTVGISILALLTIPVMGVFSVTFILVPVCERLKMKEYYWGVFLLLVPLVIYLSGYVVFDESYLHSLCMPLPDKMFIDLFVCSLFLIFSLILIAVFPDVTISKFQINENVARASSLLCLVIMTFCLSYRDPAYRTLIKLSRLVENMEWKKAESLATAVKHPTKGIDAYRVISALALGKVDDKLFDVQLPYSNFHSHYVEESIVYRVDEFFYASFFAMAQNLSMDIWVQMGENYRSLKQFVLIALLRQEDALASRYIRLMKDAPALRSLAMEYEQYLGNRDLLFEKYPIYKQLIQAVPAENHPQVISNHLSSFYLSYNTLESGLIGRRIMANLYQHKIDDAFSEYVLFRKSGWKEAAPKCFTEAIVIKSILENNMSTVEKMQIDPLLVYRVQACFNDFSKYRSDIMKASEIMYPKYKGMYCFYYLFDNYKFDEK